MTGEEILYIIAIIIACIVIAFSIPVIIHYARKNKALKKELKEIYARKEGVNERISHEAEQYTS